MTRPEGEPMFPIPAVYLIHGNGESTRGPVKKLQAVLAHPLFVGAGWIGYEIKGGPSSAAAACGVLKSSPLVS